MRGLSFVNGAYVGELGPGAYRIAGTRKHIELVDMRPQPVLLDRRAYTDAWGNPAFISISADLLVSHPYRASTELKNQIHDCLPIARNAVRSALTRSTASEGVDNRTRIAADIEQAVNAELEPVGMKVQKTAIVEFWVAPMTREVTGMAQ